MNAGELALTIVVVAAVTLALTLWTMRRKASTWSGEVETVREVRRTRQRDENAPRTTKYYVQIRARTDAGKRVKVELEKHVFQRLYPTGLEPGDRITKQAGEWYPTLSDTGDTMPQAAQRL